MVCLLSWRGESGLHGSVDGEERSVQGAGKFVGGHDVCYRFYCMDEAEGQEKGRCHLSDVVVVAGLTA